jgi:hypothetical protein
MRCRSRFHLDGLASNAHLDANIIMTRPNDEPNRSSSVDQPLTAAGYSRRVDFALDRVDDVVAVMLCNGSASRGNLTCRFCRRRSAEHDAPGAPRLVGCPELARGWEGPVPKLADLLDPLGRGSQ